MASIKTGIDDRTINKNIYNRKHVHVKRQTLIKIIFHMQHFKVSIKITGFT